MLAAKRADAFLTKSPSGQQLSSGRNLSFGQQLSLKQKVEDLTCSCSCRRNAAAAAKNATRQVRENKLLR